MSRLGFLFVAGTLLFSTQAHALVLCARSRDAGVARSGAPIRVRDTCRANEVQLDPVQLGLQGPPGPPDRGAIARDAKDAIIGSAGLLLAPDPLEELPGVQVVVGTPVLAGRSTPIVASVVDGGFVTRWDTPGQVLFESSDCTGPAYWADGLYPPATYNGLVRPAKIIGPVVAGSYFAGTPMTIAGDGVVAYVADGSPSPRSLPSFVDNVPAAECETIGQVPLPNGTCCMSSDATPMLASRAVAIDVAPFVPPFRIDAR